MSESLTNPSGQTTTSLSGQRIHFFREVDQLCDGYEQALQSGQEPDLAEALIGLESDCWPSVLAELLMIELDHAKVRDVPPETRIEQLKAAHPELADRIRVAYEKLRQRLAIRDPSDTTTHLFPSGVRLVESAASNSIDVACPTCERTFPIAADVQTQRVTCSHCGSDISLVENRVETRVAKALHSVAHFRLLSRLGVGGCGTVWKAHDTKLDRSVAIKIPRSGAFDSKEEERFLREARTAAQLSHPNIVSTYEVGHDGDNTYLACEFIRGVPLSSWLTAKKLTPREAAELVVKLATALHYAHDQGVIHRDIKPANVMMDAEGEPRITDFGLAKREFGDESISADGQVIGTPAYMSPEQARGDSFSANRQTDVYALGVLLFQLLTQELPFRGNIEMLLHQIQYDSPPNPWTLNPGIPVDLATISLKCMEKAPGRRYSSAKALAEDLQRFLNDEPILARKVSPLVHAWRWCRRKPAAAGLLGVIFLLAMFGPGVAWRQSKLRRQAQVLAEDRKTLLAELTNDRSDSQETMPLQFEFRPLTSQLRNGAIKHVERILNEGSSDAASPLETGMLQLSAGLLTAQSGDVDKALQWLHDAKESFDMVRQEQPNETNAAAAIAYVYSVEAQLHQLQNELPQAVEALQKSASLWKTVTAQAPDQLTYHRQMAETQLRLALVESERGLDAVDRDLVLQRLNNVKQSMQWAESPDTTWPTVPRQFYEQVCELLRAPTVLISDP